MPWLVVENLPSKQYQLIEHFTLITTYWTVICTVHIRWGDSALSVESDWWFYRWSLKLLFSCSFCFFSVVFTKAKTCLNDRHWILLYFKQGKLLRWFWVWVLVLFDCSPEESPTPSIEESHVKLSCFTQRLTPMPDRSTYRLSCCHFSQGSCGYLGLLSLSACHFLISLSNTLLNHRARH